MQPLQCVLQAEIPKHHETAMCKNTQNTSKQPLKCGLLPASAEPSPHPPRTRGTFHRRPEPLCPKKHKVSCPGFPPKMKPMQHPCSHYNGFCNIRIQTRICRRTWQHITTTIMHPLHCDLQPECQLTHHHSLSIVSHFSLWCDVNSHTTAIHWV